MSIELDVTCDCGRDLEVTWRGDGTLVVTPCEQCLAEAKAAGDKEGYERAIDEEP